MTCECSTKHHAAERNPRKEGPDADCEPPTNPKWAINRLWRKGITLISLLALISAHSSLVLDQEPEQEELALSDSENN